MNELIVRWKNGEVAIYRFTTKGDAVTAKMIFENHCRDEIKDIKIQALEQDQRWIPVSERLPEPNVAVLTYINTGATETYCLAYWNDACEAWEEWIGIDLIEKDKGYKVIAWRELPEPY